jgi:phosphoribosylglycinamide formyltransferase
MIPLTRVISVVPMVYSPSSGQTTCDTHAVGPICRARRCMRSMRLQASPLPPFPGSTMPHLATPVRGQSLHVKALSSPSSSPSSSSKSIAVFVSGGGSNFRAIHQDILDDRINGHISVVVTNAPSCAAAGYAREHGIPVVVYPPSKRPANAEAGVRVCSTPLDLVETLESNHVDLVVLAGYMKLVPAEVVQAFPRKILNIHPGLLPGPFGGSGMYGIRVHTAVINSGSRVSGATVHFVNEVFDEGPILSQAVVPVFIRDTPDILARRVLKQEHELFPRCVAAFCDERIRWRDDGVPYCVEDL